MGGAAVGFVTFEWDAAGFDEVVDWGAVLVDIGSSCPGWKLVDDALCGVGIWGDDEGRDLELAPNGGDKERVCRLGAYGGNFGAWV